MFAVVEIAGLQFEVENKKTLNVPLLDGKIGDKVKFDNIVLAGEGSDTKIGSPYIEGNVEAKILGHGKGDKVIVFKKKRRKGYRKLKGHRQNYTTIEITKIKI